MKRILVLKTASESIMQQLLEELLAMKAEIYCLVQSSAVELYEKRYPNLIVINSNAEAFNEECLDFSELKKYNFNEIYVPSSTSYFRNYDNIFFIIDRLCYKKLVLFDCYGNKKQFQKKNKVENWLEYVATKLLFSIFSFNYEMKTKIQGEK